MNSVLVLIPITLFIIGVAVLIFFWAVRSGQFDDLESPAYDILMEDEGRHSEHAKNDGENEGT